MRVICAYCQRAGRPCLMREKAPYDSQAESHTLCNPCLEEQMAIARTLTAPAAVA